MIKIVNSMGKEATQINLIKATYDKFTTNIILNSEKLKAFSLRSGTREGYLCLPLLSTSIGSPSHSNQTRNKTKRNPNVDNDVGKR